jgi:glycosyltransferase involved in cell wall biosynthesis
MRNGRLLHAVYLHRPHVADAYLPVIQKHAPQARIVYQCHDLHHLRERRRHEAGGGIGPGTESERWRAIEERVLAAAHAVHTPSSFEREWIARRFPGKTVRDVPIYFWERAPLDGAPADGGDLRRRSAADLLFVGGFRHPPNEDAVLWCAREILPLVREQVPSARLIVVGGNPTPAVKALASAAVVLRGRLGDDELGTAYRAARGVVVPLRWGAGVKGKLVESLAWGVPVVTTPVGAEGISGVEGATGIAADPRAFAAEVLRIIRDDDVWRARRRAGLDLVAREFSVERARAIILADFERQEAACRIPVSAQGA